MSRSGYTLLIKNYEGSTTSPIKIIIMEQADWK